MKTAKIDKMNEKDLKWMKVDEKYCQSNDFKSSSSYHIISYLIIRFGYFSEGPDQGMGGVNLCCEYCRAKAHLYFTAHKIYVRTDRNLT